MDAKEEIVIVIPGAKYLSSRARPLQHIIVFLYGLTRILKPVYTNYAREWAGEFSKKRRKVFWLRWNRGFTVWSRWLGIRRLKHVIRQYDRRHTVKLVGISLGGDIALEAAKDFDGLVSKVVLICSTNTVRNVSFARTEVINIYSPYDLFAEIAAKILAPINGGTVLEGKNVKNILIEGFSHDEFCANERIKSGPFKGKTITQLVNRFL